MVSLAPGFMACGLLKLRAVNQVSLETKLRQGPVMRSHFSLLRRLDREMKTIAVMIGMFCKAHHVPDGGLCSECRALRDHAQHRISKCPHERNKPSCAKCEIHCFRSEMRERMRTVMRYAGPRMLLRHPILALLHSLDSFRSGALNRSARLSRARQLVAVSVAALPPGHAFPTTKSGGKPCD